MITKEIETLRDFIADTADYSRIWLQYLPDKYTAGELAIRYMGDDSIDETGFHYRLDRDYQFVYFGATEVDCLQKASAIQRKVNNAKTIKIKDSDNYLQVESFSFSQPFKTEGGSVFAVIGVLQAQARYAREFEQSPKMQEINVDYIDDK